MTRPSRRPARRAVAGRSATGRAGVNAASGGGGGNAGGVGAVPFLAVGSTWGLTGDGLNSTSGGVGAGPSNPANQFQILAEPRLQHVPAAVMARSGTSISSATYGNIWINPYAIQTLALQRPNLFIFSTCGANENLLGSDPATFPGTQDWKDAVTAAYALFVGYAGSSLAYLFRVTGTAPSEKSGENTWRTAVWAAQAAHVNAIAATDNRVAFVDVSSMVPPANFSIDSPLYVHYDERGGYGLGALIWASVSAYVENKTTADILDMIYAGTYPLMSGSQLFADRNMTGTAGTLTGSGLTSAGGIATTQNVTSATGATMTAEMAVDSGARNKVVIALNGTSSSAGRVQWGTKASQSVTASPGQLIRTGTRVIAPAGYFNFGQSNGNFGTFGQGSANGDNTRDGAGDLHTLDTVFTTSEFPLFGNNTSYACFIQGSLFWRISTALTGNIEISQEFLYVLSQRGAYPSAYIGALADGAGVAFFSASATGQKLRVTGTITASAGGTLRAEPGFWVPSGLVANDFTARRFYKGTASDTTIGSGTQIGSTMTGTTWTTTFGAAVVLLNDKVWVEVDLLDPFDGVTTITQRCQLTGVVTATA